MRVKSMLVAGSIVLMPWVGLTAANQAKGASKAPAKGEVHGVNPANLDTAVKPCQDFYDYATGGWRAHNSIPAAYPRWGTFDELRVRNQDDLHTILEACEKNTKAPEGSIERKLGDFYYAAMNEKKCDADGIKPIEPELARIEAVKDVNGLMQEVVRLQKDGVNVFFGLGSEQDRKDATKVIAGIGQGGLSLPDRDYYLKDDAKTKAIRAAYVKHVTKVFEFLGETPEAAAADAQTVLKLETGLAKVSMPRVKMRDPKATYNPMPVAKLETLAPVFPWKPYFGEVGLPSLASIDVGMPDFFKGMSEQLKTVPLKDWKVYLRWHLASSASRCLSSNFVKENFEFSKTFTGAKEDLPRWRKAVSATNGALGEDLGQLYVKQYFSPESKAKVLEILHNIRKALKEDLTTLAWMSPATRKQAIAKLDMIVEKIGYPDKWKDYSALKITRDSYYGNAVRAARFEFKRDIEKVGKPVDRTEWHMTPPTVNAYYNPAMNEIVFPAGILQPPFFDPKADDAVNYGAIGAVMGHEITHGFDDQGCQFDGKGNLHNWWQPADLKNFKARGEKIADQFSSYIVDGDKHLNGKLVEGEAIADLGGITLAYRAYHLSLKGKPQPKTIDGFTPDQRFFLGFATVWAGNIRPQFARMLATIDPHPPARYRVNGTLANVPAFAKAFHCKPGSPMAHAKDKLCEVW